jgi:methenyltetrahydrofolate cyclohydrolase
LNSPSVRDLTLQQFEDRLASDSPMPAGGALAAVTLSFAAALLQMCLAITEKKRPGPGVAKLKEQTAEALAQLRGAADEDIAAFDSYIAALRLPKSDDDERQARDAARQSALMESTRVPLESLHRALHLSELAIEAVGEVSIVVLSDLGTALELLRASTRSLLLNVVTNLRGLKTPGDEDAQSLFELYDETLAKYFQLDSKLVRSLTTIAERIKQG